MTAIVMVSGSLLGPWFTLFGFVAFLFALYVIATAYPRPQEVRLHGAAVAVVIAAVFLVLSAQTAEAVPYGICAYAPWLLECWLF